MTVSVQPLIGTTISTLIDNFCGPALSTHDANIFDYCQSLGEVYTGFVDDEFICCWGLIPPSFLSTQAYLWMWAPSRSSISSCSFVSRRYRFSGCWIDTIASWATAVLALAPHSVGCAGSGLSSSRRGMVSCLL